MKQLKNKPWFIWIRIIVVWMSYIPLGIWLTSQKPVLDFYYLTLPLSDNVRLYWFSENFYNLLIMGLLTVGVFILLIFRYRFSIADNLRLTPITAFVGLICLAVSIASIIYAHNYNGYSYLAMIGESIKLLLAVSVFEELIFRGFITNELFRLKIHGLNPWIAMIISAILFGLMHLPAYFIYEDVSLSGTLFRFTFPTIIGFLYAIYLYYKKDILSLIFIHTASNICGSIAGSPFDIAFFILFGCYVIVSIPSVQRLICPFKTKRS